MEINISELVLLGFS